MASLTWAADSETTILSRAAAAAAAEILRIARAGTVFGAAAEAEIVSACVAPGRALVFADEAGHSGVETSFGRIDPLDFVAHGADVARAGGLIDPGLPIREGFADLGLRLRRAGVAIVLARSGVDCGAAATRTPGALFVRWAAHMEPAWRDGPGDFTHVLSVAAARLLETEMPGAGIARDTRILAALTRVSGPQDPAVSEDILRAGLVYLRWVWRLSAANPTNVRVAGGIWFSPHRAGEAP